MSNYVFKRIEKKYLISDYNFNILRKRIDPYMTVDDYGLHTICNIYYDTDNYELIRNSIEKPKYKEKLRLRSYGKVNNDNKVYLELKKKYCETVFKRRIALTLEEAINYLEHGIKPPKNSQILNEIDYCINFYKPEKKVFIAYDRIAFFGKEDKNFRITFDMNIRSRAYDLDLSKGDFGKVLDNFNGYLMEVKTTGALPIWLVNILSEMKIYPSSFSKYGTVYKNELINTLYKDINITPQNCINEWRINKCLQAS